MLGNDLTGAKTVSYSVRKLLLTERIGMLRHSGLAGAQPFNRTWFPLQNLLRVTAILIWIEVIVRCEKDDGTTVWPLRAFVNDTVEGARFAYLIAVPEILRQDLVGT
jgi:hypothetical protein